MPLEFNRAEHMLLTTGPHSYPQLELTRLVARFLSTDDACNLLAFRTLSWQAVVLQVYKQAYYHTHHQRKK